MAPAETHLVSRELSEFFQSPDDLLKIAAFRKKLAKEKASIDAKLKSGVKEQLDATRDGLRKLFGTRNNVQGIRDEMAAIDMACGGTNKELKMYDQISRVCHMYRGICTISLIYFAIGITCSSQLRSNGRDGPKPH